MRISKKLKAAIREYFIVKHILLNLPEKIGGLAKLEKGCCKHD